MKKSNILYGLHGKIVKVDDEFNVLAKGKSSDQIIKHKDKKIYGVTALFNDPNVVTAAARKVADSGFKNWDVNAPYPIHGIDKARA